MSLVEPHGARLPWEDLPAWVRGWVADELGARVLEAVTQPGGFSPGVAARLVLADGRRAFVKAVGPEPNADSVGIHRREVAVRADMPVGLPVPTTLGTLDREDWVVILQQDIEGRHPDHPWTAGEARSALEALAVLGSTTAPMAWPDLQEEVTPEFTAWSRLAADPPEDLDPWAAERLEDLDGLARATLPRMSGSGIVHSDVRSDNLLVDAAGAVWVIDWPWASRGAGWFDAATLLVNIRLYGDLDVRPLLPIMTALGATDEDVVGVVAGFGGFFAEASRQPPSPGLPTLRGFQRAQEVASLQLLRELL